MECEFCKKSFSIKANLTKHQKTAKYCLKIQHSLKFICSGCDKELSTKQSLNIHYQSCEKYKTKDIENLIIEKIEKNLIIEKVEKENLELRERIKEQQEHIKELENKLENIALKAICRPTTTNNNKTQINYLQPVTDERFETSASKLTLDYLLKGPEGYAQFALEHPLKDSVVCTDFARRKVEYKEADGNVKTDPEMIYLTSKFFKSIRDKNSEILKKHGKAIFGEDDDSLLQNIADYITSVNKGSQGEKSDFHHDFVREVCSRTVKE